MLTLKPISSENQGNVECHDVKITNYGRATCKRNECTSCFYFKSSFALFWVTADIIESVDQNFIIIIGRLGFISGLDEHTQNRPGSGKVNNDPYKGPLQPFILYVDYSTENKQMRPLGQKRAEMQDSVMQAVNSPWSDEKSISSLCCDIVFPILCF